MRYQLQDDFRPLAQLSSWAAVCFLLLAPAAFSQQKVNSSVKADAASSTDATSSTNPTSSINQRIMQLSQASTAKQGDYVIGGGDVLSIDVFDVPELTREVHVNETGFISLPLIPTKIRANGLTTFQLQEKLEELLRTNGLVSNPEVTIFVKEQHSQPVTVIGAVKNPMVFQAGRQTTLLEVLSRAGGVAEDAGSVVMITRSAVTPAEAEDADVNANANAGNKDNQNKDALSSTLPPPPQTFTIGLNDLLDTGDGRFNIPIVGGDVVSVPRAGIVYVVGAVVRSGGFVMQNDRDRMTALKVLALAGGTTGTAKTHSAIILRRNPDTGQNQEVPVDLARVLHLKSEDVTLQASDILYIPNSNAKKALAQAGQVALQLATGVALVRATGGI